jgi:Tol biopolymer transport system component
MGRTLAVVLATLAVLPTADAVAARDDLLLADRASGIAGAKANGPAHDLDISADGRFVAFGSSASNLDPGDPAAGSDDVFARDTQSGITSLVSRASGASGAKADAASQAPAISDDGRFVAFVSGASNLDPAATGNATNVFVRDRQANTTTLVSRASGVAGGAGNYGSDEPAISADGRFVAFTSTATNLDPADAEGGPLTGYDVYVRDLQTSSTVRVSRASDTSEDPSTLGSFAASLSSDGRFVAFDSVTVKLTPAGLQTSSDVYVRDIQAARTELVSRSDGVATPPGNGLSGKPAISADGRFVVFESLASNLAPSDPDAICDVFVRDLRLDKTTLASRAAGAGGTKGNGGSVESALSADGQRVAFASDSSNLHPDDGDTSVDGFVRDVSGWPLPAAGWPPPVPAPPAAAPAPAPPAASAPPPPPPPAPLPPAAAPAPPPARLAAAVIGAGSPGAVRVGRSGSILLARPRVTCPAAAPACSVSTTTTRRTARAARLGSATSSILPGASARVRLKLDARAMRLLRRVKRLAAAVRIVARHGDRISTKTVRVTLLASRRRG